MGSIDGTTLEGITLGVVEGLVLGDTVDGFIVGQSDGLTVDGWQLGLLVDGWHDGVVVGVEGTVVSTGAHDGTTEGVTLGELGTVEGK